MDEVAARKYIDDEITYVKSIYTNLNEWVSAVNAELDGYSKYYNRNHEIVESYARYPTAFTQKERLDILLLIRIRSHDVFIGYGKVLPKIDCEGRIINNKDLFNKQCQYSIQQKTQQLDDNDKQRALASLNKKLKTINKKWAKIPLEQKKETLQAISEKSANIGDIKDICNIC